jgi:hypothetical protein
MIRSAMNTVYRIIPYIHRTVLQYHIYIIPYPGTVLLYTFFLRVIKFKIND